MDPEKGLRDIMAGMAVIAHQRRLFDDFFKIDELMVAHLQNDGTMSSVRRRLVFERGDSVAVLLFNRDQRTVVLVEQFKVPALVARRRDDPLPTAGWWKRLPHDRFRRNAASSGDPRNPRRNRLPDCHA
jgi:hypothetical protein